MKILSLNIWFDVFLREKRYAAIHTALRNLSPDVCCFQEVIPQFLDELSSNNWINDYDISLESINEIKVNSYGTLILVKKKYNASFQYYPFNHSEMGRSLNCATITTNSEDDNDKTSIKATTTTIATCHLESLNNSDMRKSQLEQIHELFNTVTFQTNHIIINGDFNFDSYRDFKDIRKRIRSKHIEQDHLISIMNDYTDIWTQFHSNLKGFTFDERRNLMLKAYKEESSKRNKLFFPGKYQKQKQIEMEQQGEDDVFNFNERDLNDPNSNTIDKKDVNYERMRYDRTLYRPSSSSSSSIQKLIALDVELFGDTPILNTITSDTDMSGSLSQLFPDTSVPVSPPPKSRSNTNSNPISNHFSDPVYFSDHFGLLATFKLV